MWRFRRSDFKLEIPQVALDFFRRWWAYIHLFWVKVNRDGLFDRSSTLSFQFLFSLIPIIALAYSVFAFVGGMERLQTAVQAWILENLTPSLGEQVKGYLQSIEKSVSPRALGLFGILGFLYVTVNLIMKAEESLSAIWGVKSARPLMRRVPLYFGAVVLTPLVLGGSLVMTSFLASVVTSGLDFLLPTGLGLRRAVVLTFTLAPVVVSSFFFSFVYAILPYAPVGRNAALKAGLATGVILEFLKQGFTFYATYSLGNSVYGVLAALPILFIWISLGSLVFLLGAELCYFLDQKSYGGIRVARAESDLSLEMLTAILKVLDQGRSKAIDSSPSWMDLRDLVQQINWDTSVVIRHLEFLKAQNLIEFKKISFSGRAICSLVLPNAAQGIHETIQRMNQIKFGLCDHGSLHEHY